MAWMFILAFVCSDSKKVLLKALCMSHCIVPFSFTRSDWHEAHTLSLSVSVLKMLLNSFIIKVATGHKMRTWMPSHLPF